MMSQTTRILPIAAVLAAATISAAPLSAQKSEPNAFTWSGKIPEGRWINVRNMNGTVEVEPGSGDKVEVTGTRRTRRGDPEYVRFEVRKYGSGDQDVLICALWGENTDCDEDSYRSRN